MPEHLRGYRILIIEDEYFLGADLENALRAEGAEIIGPVALVEEARSLIAGHICHAAVVDIKLPDGNGFTIADELARREIPFVFATGYGAETIPDRFRAMLRWQKPYNPEEAINDLAQMLRTK